MSCGRTTTPELSVGSLSSFGFPLTRTVVASRLSKSSARRRCASTCVTRASAMMASRRRTGMSEGSGTEEAPAFQIPITAAIISVDRSISTPTRDWLLRPYRRRWCATWLARSLRSRNVTWSVPHTTATPSGVRSTCASNRSGMVSTGTGRASSVQLSLNCLCSAGDSRSIAPQRMSGSATTAVRARRKYVVIRSIVDRSNRSVAYSRELTMPAGVPSEPRRSRIWKTRSTFAAVLPRGISVASRSTSWVWKSLVLSKASITWNNGCRANDRSGFSTSTNRSNGTSWCSNAPTSPSRTRPTNSPKVGSPDTSTRNTNVFTKNPTRSATASSSRPATGLPTTTSVPPPNRDNSTARPARTTMNNEAPHSAAIRANPAWTSAGTTKPTESPRKLATAGRRRSTGRLISSGMPASRSRQNASCRETTLPGSSSEPSNSRCHSV